MWGIKDELKKNNYLFEELSTQDLLIQRCKSCMEWYIRKACFYKYLFYIFSILGIICPILVTIFDSISLDKNQWIFGLNIRATAIIFSGIASFSIALLSLFRARDHWVEYRCAAEYLKREMIYYKLGIGDYAQKDKDIVFIHTIEKQMEKENISWSLHNQNMEKENKSNQEKEEFK